MNKRQSGFSLVEMLVVIAIIGVISLVTVPNFIAMRQQSMLKNSMRSFVGDIRGIRQVAVTKHLTTKLKFTTGTATTARQYTIWQSPDAGTTWNQIGGPKLLEETCYVVSQTNFTTPDTGATYEILFRPDGTVILTSGTFQGTAVLKTDYKIPTNQYTVTVQYSGAVKAL